MRLPHLETDPNATPLPMLEPEIQSIEICPYCRGKLRRTSEGCPHCGAQRQFGPTRNESLVCTIIGLIAVPSISLLVLPPSIWTLAFTIAGALLGFFVSHGRFGGDRWLPPPGRK